MTPVLEEGHGPFIHPSRMVDFNHSSAQAKSRSKIENYSNERENCYNPLECSSDKKNESEPHSHVDSAEVVSSDLESPLKMEEAPLEPPVSEVRHTHKGKMKEDPKIETATSSKKRSSLKSTKKKSMRQTSTKKESASKKVILNSSAKPKSSTKNGSKFQRSKF